MMKYSVKFYYAARPTLPLVRKCIEIDAISAQKAWEIVAEKLQSNNAMFEFISTEEIKKVEEKKVEENKKNYLVHCEYYRAQYHCKVSKSFKIEASDKEEARKIAYEKHHDDEGFIIHSIKEIKQQARGCRDINHLPEFRGDPRG